MQTILITGGSGFFGSLLKRHLLMQGFACVNADLIADIDTHENLTSYVQDIRDERGMRALFKKYRFDAVLHCAAVLAHGAQDKRFLWSSNVDGTDVVARCAKEFGVRRVIFLSSNCLWGREFPEPVSEEEPPAPVELYGQSKWEGEKILLAHGDSFHVIIFRCPTIVDTGRLGLLAILFEFIAEGRKVWLVGKGNNVYQFIYAQDLIDACVRALSYDASDVFNIGSDNVQSFRDVYQTVIDRADTGARVASLPRGLAIFAMKLAYFLKLSPLGPYQYKMIASSFVFDTAKIKQKLGWQPTMGNADMLYKAYRYFEENRSEIESRKDVSAHSKSAKMGVIRLLKWLS